MLLKSLGIDDKTIVFVLGNRTKRRCRHFFVPALEQICPHVDYEAVARAQTLEMALIAVCGLCVFREDPQDAKNVRKILKIFSDFT